MQRHREIGAAPRRTTGETVDAIGGLIEDTLSCAAAIDSADVVAGLIAARPALLSLVAGGHLGDAPLILAAADLRLEISTVAGDGAVDLEENLSPVPGAATAQDWKLGLPTPDPLAALVQRCSRAHPRLVAGDPEPVDERAPEPSPKAASIDIAALRRRAIQ